MTPLEAALAYAKLGIRVIPITPGQKHPPIKGWQDKATTNTNTITQWWTHDYPNYGIGIATGKTKHSYIFVLDVDDREEYKGSDTLHDLEQRYGALPETVTAITGTGGQHLYYYATTEIRNDAGSRLGIGLDIRGTGGQVLADPTIHPNGRQYNWVDGASPLERKPAQAPQWMIELLTKQPTMVKPPEQPDTFIHDQTSPSARFNTETNWETILIKDGWTLAKTDRYGEQHWTRPGKDTRDGTSATIGHNGNDALIVFTSSIPWLPEGGYSRFGYVAARDHNGDWKQAAKTYLNQHPNPPPPTTEPTQDEMLSMLIKWDDFWQGEHAAEEWIAKPLIAKGRQTALFAGAKTGKSWLTLNVVAALATGKPILGQTAQPPTHVLYLDYEMIESDLYERLETFGYTEDDDWSHFHYAIIPSLPPLNTQEGANSLKKLVELTKAEVVIIDTTGRAIDGEENSADSYREFARTTGLTLKRLGVACVRTDHAGKDGGKKLGQRGSSAKNDDVDIVYRLDKTEEGLRLKRTHTRIGWVPETVELIVDDMNDTTTIRYKHKQQEGWTQAEIDLGKRLDDLGYPRDMATTAIMQDAKLRGITLAHKKTVLRANQARNLPRPDPLERFPTNNENRPQTQEPPEPSKEPPKNRPTEANEGKGTSLRIEDTGRFHPTPHPTQPNENQPPQTTPSNPHSSQPTPALQQDTPDTFNDDQEDW